MGEQRWDKMFGVEQVIEGHYEKLLKQKFCILLNTVNKLYKLNRR